VLIGSINAIIYYAPTIFEQIGLSGGSISLLATGIVGIVNFVMTIPAVLFVDNFGRRPLLMWGEANMAISHAVLAAVIAVYGGNLGQNKAAGNVSHCACQRRVPAVWPQEPKLIAIGSCIHGLLVHR
jgi:MFS family permease